MAAGFPLLKKQAFNVDVYKIHVNAHTKKEVLRRNSRDFFYFLPLLYKLSFTFYLITQEKELIDVYKRQVLGCSDFQIARFVLNPTGNMEKENLAVRAHRKSMGILPAVKRIRCV